MRGLTLLGGSYIASSFHSPYLADRATLPGGDGYADQWATTTSEENTYNYYYMTSEKEIFTKILVKLFELFNIMTLHQVPVTNNWFARLLLFTQHHAHTSKNSARWERAPIFTSSMSLVQYSSNTGSMSPTIRSSPTTLASSCRQKDSTRRMRH